MAGTSKGIFELNNEQRVGSQHPLKVIADSRLSLRTTGTILAKTYLATTSAPCLCKSLGASIVVGPNCGWGMCRDEMVATDQVTRNPSSILNQSHRAR